MAGLYVHVPFCAARCRFCRFYSVPGAPAGDREAYLDALAREARHWARTLAPAPFGTVYLGGGTPSILGAEGVTRVLALLGEALPWARGAEITCEVNPDDVDAALARGLARAGVTRVSVGAQTFQPRLLRALGRRHDAQKTRRAVALLRGAGVKNLSLDLMICLPGQTLRELDRDLDEIFALAPEHVTVYELVVEEGGGAAAARKRLEIPGPAGQTRRVERTARRLNARGFRRYELLSYARPGRESAHNRNYWLNGPYLGLGPGAWSSWDGRRFQTAGSLREYLGKAARGDWGPAFEEHLTGAEKEAESLLLALRLEQGADLAAYPGLRGHLARELPPLRRAGLVAVRGGRLRLTRKGRLSAETVFEYLCWTGDGRGAEA